MRGQKREVADKDRETKGEQRERLLGKACSVTEPHKMGRGRNLLLISSPLHPVSIFSSNPSGFLSGQKSVLSQGLGRSFRIGLVGTTLSNESQSQTDDASSVIRQITPFNFVSVRCKHLIRLLVGLVLKFKGKKRV